MTNTADGNKTTAHSFVPAYPSAICKAVQAVKAAFAVERAPFLHSNIAAVSLENDVQRSIVISVS